MLYQLSYFRMLWAEMDSNHRRRSQLSYSQPHLSTLVSALAFRNALLAYPALAQPPLELMRYGRVAFLRGKGISFLIMCKVFSYKIFFWFL